MLTLGQARDHYLQHLALAGRSPKTLAHYAAYLADFVAFGERHGCGPNAPADRLTRDVITAYQLDLAGRAGERGAPMSLATRNLYGVALRGMLRHAVNVLGMDVPAPDSVVLA